MILSHTCHLLVKRIFKLLKLTWKWDVWDSSYKTHKGGGGGEQQQHIMIMKRYVRIPYSEETKTLTSLANFSAVSALSNMMDHIWDASS